MKTWGMKGKKPELQKRDEKRDVLEGLENRCKYFRSYSESNYLFKPEYETAKAVNSILSGNEILSDIEIHRVIDLINGINKIEHYDGSGWFDYLIRVSCFLRLCGIKTEVSNGKLLLPT